MGEADARGGAAWRQARGSRDRRPGAGPGGTADQTAVGGDLCLRCALHGPPELGGAVRLGLRSRHHDGPRVHRRGGRPRSGLFGRISCRYSGHQPADADPRRRRAARHRAQPRRSRCVRRTDARVGDDVSEGARRRAERLCRGGGRVRGGGVLRSLFGYRSRRAAAGHRRGRHRPVDSGGVGRPGCQPDRGVGLQRRPARVRQDVRRRRPGQPVVSRPVRGVAGDVPGQRFPDNAGHLRMRGPQRAAAEHRRLMRVHGAGVLSRVAGTTRARSTAPMPRTRA